MPHRTRSCGAGTAGGSAGRAASVGRADGPQRPYQRGAGHMTILLTGAAGFIGYHVAEALLARGERVIGVDSLNDYYDQRLKQARLDRLVSQPGFAFHHLDISDRDA